ncbi:MAG TPA: hypothetical protein PLB33_07505, partial [Sedimentibacter sp.]|nr:hypothetical protein [Sedimentibacter sp.]
MFGSHVTRLGTNVIRNRTNIRGIRNGRIALYILSIDISATLAHTNSDVPTGGVERPIIRLRINTIPRCTGSIPKLPISGIKNGIVIVMT